MSFLILIRRFSPKRERIFICIGLALLVMATGAQAQNFSDNLPLTNGYFNDWFARVTRIQSVQPNWPTPMNLISPRLTEQFRYDQSWDDNNKGGRVTSYGSGKGLELIPWDNIEVILGLPSWQSYNKPSGIDGFADDSFLVKYRFASANRENGNYIVSGFLGLSVPSGKQSLSQDRYVLTPTIALGKGWGDFDLQTTLGVAVPDNDMTPKGLGTPVLFNTVLQYQVAQFFWPEVEANYSYWGDGAREGDEQLFISPGLVVGPFPIWERLGVAFGAAYQVAVTDHPAFNHNFELSMRIIF